METIAPDDTGPLRHRQGDEPIRSGIPFWKGETTIGGSVTRFLSTFVLGALFVAAGCTNTEPVAPVFTTRPSFQQGPADGNGGKVVIPIDVEFPDFATCGNGATLSLHVVGWVQVHLFSQESSRYVQLNDVLLVFTYSNAAGQTFVWREVGADHLFLDQNGDLIRASSGRDGFDGVIGHLMINETTGEVQFLAGNPGFRDDLACAALT